ncbi:ribonuclease P protein component [Candidatus Azambacteria bacterium]|nr:ribonuclease P protein component [Candidatus Azambacteria bacterium]
MLTRTRRIVTEKDFNAVLGRGRFVATPFFLLKYIRNNSAKDRYGFVVSKKVSKKATERNKAKRRLRAIVQKNPHVAAQGRDMVFVAKKGIIDAQFNDIKEAVFASLKKILPTLPQ